jgi:hypothetical protein
MKNYTEENNTIRKGLSRIKTGNNRRKVLTGYRTE